MEQEIVVAEIMQDKIFLDLSGHVAVAPEQAPDLETLMGDAGPDADKV